MPLPSVVVAPAARLATLVLRQNRRLLYAPPTCMSVVQQLTVKIVPMRLFSGRPPSAGGLNLGSRQVPVQVGGSCGSILAPECVSLYVTRVRWSVVVP